jgi:hypothetical protein
MTNDDFLGELRADWQRQAIDVKGLATRISARKRRAQLVIGFNLAGVAALTLLATWFSFVALREGNALFGVGALAMFVAVPVTLFEMLDFRRANRLRYEDSPTGLLAQARHQAVVTRRHLRSCRLAALLLIGAALAAWALVPAGLARFDIVLSVTAIWAATAFLTWAWQIWRDGRLVAEIAGYDRLRGDYED